MNIKELERHWNSLGETDPLWAILTSPEKKNNKWDIKEFFESGKKEIGALLDVINGLKVNLRKNRALDFGCGVGRLSQALADHFSEVVGVDIAQTMIKLANEHNQKGEKVKYVCNASSSLEVFSDNHFDLIYSNITLQHMEPRYAKAYLKEFVRIVAPNGLIIFQLPSHPRSPLKRIIKTFLPSSVVARIKSLLHSDFPRFEMYETRKGDIVRFKKTGGNGFKCPGRFLGRGPVCQFSLLRYKALTPACSRYL